MRTLVILLVLAWVVPARAAPPPPEPTRPAAAQPARPSLSHRFQMGLGIRAGSGYRVIAPYHQEFCGDKTDNGLENKSICGGRVRTWLELSPSFGVTSALEVLVDLRFYLEPDFSDTRGLFLAPGVRYYTDPESWFKLFATGQLVFDFQDYAPAAPVSNFDFGLRSALGVHFDVLRYLGLYVQGGIVLGFKRWLTFVVDFGAGVQLRY